MRSLLEKAIVHLLNGDQPKAEALFHKFMVERAREIHESLRQNDDAQLNEGWDNEIQEEEYFDDPAEGEEGGDELSGVEDGGDGMDPAMGGEGPPMDAMGGDEGMPGEEAGMDDVVDDEGLPGEEVGEQGLDAKLDHIESQMDELSAQFDELMSKFDGGEEIPSDDLGDDDGLGGDELGADEFGGDGEVSDMGGETPGEETDDLAGRMEDDMADEDEPEHAMAESEGEDDEVMEDDEMMKDITESVLADLDRVAAVSNSDGKEIGSGGKTVNGNHGDLLPSHPVTDRVNQAKPYLVKGGGNDSFERETPPTNKTVTSRRNNDAGVKKLKTVPAKGDASANLNSDFAAKASTKPIIDGSKKVNK